MQITADSSRVVYWADQDTNDVFELYSRPADGSGAAVKLNGPLVAGGDVADFRIAPDSSRVVYRADQSTDEVFELYSRVIDASASAPHPSTSGGQIVPGTATCLTRRQYSTAVGHAWSSKARCSLAAYRNVRKNGECAW